MTAHFPIAVKFRDQESYTLFMSDGDSINLSLTGSHISKLYRHHKGMQEFDVFVEAICKLHEVVDIGKFEKMYQEYSDQEDEFLSKKREKRELNPPNDALKKMTEPKKKKGDQTLEIKFEE